MMRPLWISAGWAYHDDVSKAGKDVFGQTLTFPTDINLLLDAIRKVTDISAELAEANHLSGWRQSTYHQRQFKKHYRKIQRLRHFHLPG